LANGGRIANCVPSIEAVARTFTCVVVMPSTGAVVGDGVGGIGVSVADGMSVGARVDVMMNGVDVPEPGKPA
jgi:hypothetical protein